MDDRKKLIDRIKALMSKTTENGCTEAEAMIALEKARKLMDEHDIASADVTFDGEKPGEGCVDHSRRDRIPFNLAENIAQFCNCRAWHTHRRHDAQATTTFFGLESDVMFAKFLLSTLSQFVRSAADDYMKERKKTGDRGASIQARNGFIFGCCNRINIRLRAMKAASDAASPIVGGTALVVVKNALVEQAYAELNMKLKKAHESKATLDPMAFISGSKAGDGATIGRPIEDNSQPVLMIGRVG
ncbi:DUF2786 domain-containing protein [Methylosinus sp. PW1]|uniref:DUF2786 domain-containing protein n=1 Tax=Methylosinus sp. PW1 TaxID=107636 RepID=UPI00056A5244|nr:DUF2786 domain-containing protein [Methylosinus sp. PW1]